MVLPCPGWFGPAPADRPRAAGTPHPRTGAPYPGAGGAWDTLNGVTNSDTSPHSPGNASAAGTAGSGPATPAEFTSAAESMHAAKLRPEITLGEIRPPQRPAPFSHAVGLEVDRSRPGATVPTDSEGDAFGRLILLHSPDAEEAWEGSMRLVAYIQADMDDAVASDPLLPDVAWQWLNESLAETGAGFTNLGGTVTSTASVRFGEIGGPPRAYQLEMRASWTAEGIDLSGHVEAFAKVLAHVAGLPPEDVAQLRPR